MASSSCSANAGGAHGRHGARKLLPSLQRSTRSRHGWQMRRPAYEDLVALVEWLAMPYAGRSPIFGLTDWRGDPLPGNERLAATWEYVMGAAPEPSADVWVLCPTCGGHTVRTAIREDQHA